MVMERNYMASGSNPPFDIRRDLLLEIPQLGLGPGARADARRIALEQELPYGGCVSYADRVREIVWVHVALGRFRVSARRVTGSNRSKRGLSATWIITVKIIARGPVRRPPTAIISNRLLTLC